MNDIVKASKYIKSIIRKKPGIEEGVRWIKKRLHNPFRFYDARLVNIKAVAGGCAEFMEWLNELVISQPIPDDVVAVYFGLFRSEDGLRLYATGSKLWNERDPDWACRSDWRPEGGVLAPEVFREITKVYSDYNLAGYFITVSYTLLMILEFARKSMLTLVDDKRRAVYIACGFDDGELYNVGVMLEGGIVSLGEAARRGLLPASAL
jgi:hypothetical protein